VEREDQKVEIDAADIVVESSYKGPSFEDPEEIDAAWVENLMEWQRDEKKLHKKYTVMLINKA
jgi:serine/threonine-protein phosphatase 5